MVDAAERKSDKGKLSDSFCLFRRFFMRTIIVFIIMDLSRSSMIS